MIIAMSQKIIVVCDVCDTEPAEKYRLQINGKRGTVDLCAMHVESVITPLRDVMGMRGPNPKPTPTNSAKKANGRKVSATGKKYPCPDPDCEMVFDTPQGMGAHRAQKHGYRSGDDDSKAAPAKKTTAKKATAKKAAVRL